MSEKTNLTSLFWSIFVAIVIGAMIVPHVDIDGLNETFSKYQVLLGLASTLVGIYIGVYFYQNLTFKKETKSTNDLRREHNEELKSINDKLIKKGEKDNEQDRDINQVKDGQSKIKIEQQIQGDAIKENIKEIKEVKSDQELIKEEVKEHSNNLVSIKKDIATLKRRRK